MPCITVPLNLLETGGTRLTAFDFQLRPVGHHQSQGPVMGLLRFKDLVSKHEHGRVNPKNPISKDHASARFGAPPANGKEYDKATGFSQAKTDAEMNSVFPREPVGLERGYFSPSVPPRCGSSSLRISRRVFSRSTFKLASTRAAGPSPSRKMPNKR